jgi:hypothetical protein
MVRIALVNDRLKLCDAPPGGVHQRRTRMASQAIALAIIRTFSTQLLTSRKVIV